MDVRFLALGVMREYRHQSGGRLVRVQSFHETKAGAGHGGRRDTSSGAATPVRSCDAGAARSP